MARCLASVSAKGQAKNCFQKVNSYFPEKAWPCSKNRVSNCGAAIWSCPNTPYSIATCHRLSAPLNLAYHKNLASSLNQLRSHLKPAAFLITQELA